MSSLPTGVLNASTVMGFISFAITLATLIRVTWSELSTVAAAPTQVHFALSNLKEALWEEREACRRMSRSTRREARHRRHSGSSARAAKRFAEKGGFPQGADRSGADLRILQETMKALCQKFATIERPFLRANLVTGQKADDHWDDVETATRYEEDGFSHDYSEMGLGLRFHWLRVKSDVDSIWTALDRLQQRRTVREVTDALTELRNMRSSMRDLKLIADPVDSVDSDRDGESRVHVRRSRKGK